MKLDVRLFGSTGHSSCVTDSPVWTGWLASRRPVHELSSNKDAGCHTRRSR